MKDSAKKLLDYFLKLKAESGNKRIELYLREPLEDLDLSTEDIMYGLSWLENNGLISIWKRSKYGSDFWSIGFKDKATTTTTTSYQLEGQNQAQKMESTRVGAPCPHPQSTLNAQFSMDEGLVYNQPPRLHKRTLTSIGCLNPIATGYLRRLCKLKGSDDQWWTGYLENGKYRVSKYGKLVLHPNDNENYGLIVDEIADILHKSKIDPTISLEGFTRSAHYGYSVSGAKLDNVKEGKVRFEINSKYEITLSFDKSKGKVLEGEHLVNIKSLGEPEADKELTRIFSDRAFAYAFIKEFTDKLDYVYTTIKINEKGKKANRKIKRSRKKPLLELKVYRPSVTLAEVYGGLRVILFISCSTFIFAVLILTWGAPLYGL